MVRKIMWLGLWGGERRRDVRSKASSRIWIQFTKWVNSFIEYNITGDIDPTTSEIKTFEPLVHVTIPKKHTLLGAKLELVIIK
jgi:hypothetical protein